MMECSVEDVVLNLLCKIRVQAVKDWFYIFVVIIYHIHIDVYKRQECMSRINM